MDHYQLRQLVNGRVLPEDFLFQGAADLYRVYQTGLSPLFLCPQHSVQIYHLLVGGGRRGGLGGLRTVLRGVGLGLEQGLQGPQERRHVFQADKFCLAHLQEPAERRVIRRGGDAAVDVEDVDPLPLFKPQACRAGGAGGRQNTVFKVMLYHFS